MTPGALAPKGTVADGPAAQQLIEEARQWLRARSIDQWQDPVPGSTIIRDAQRGNLFVVREQGHVIATSTAGGPVTFGLGAAAVGLYIVDIEINGTAC